MESSDNLYFRARKEAAKKNERLWSREKAAELLGISPSTLANYELGVTKTIPPDMVVMMADLYNAPELKNHYCASDCPIGRCMSIPTRVENIEKIAAKAMSDLKHLDEAKEKLWEISADGEPTQENIAAAMWLKTYLDRLVITLGELNLTCHKFLTSGGVNVKG
jgi:transcriptional regulator with XRE-family HTH domain